MLEVVMGFFELGTAENMLAKAKRELTRLEAEASIDHAYNFFVTAYHIIDYLDGRLSKPVVDSILNDPLIQICGDACNKAKHMRLTRNRPDVATPIYSSACGQMPFNTVACNTSGERWIVWQNGSSLEVVRFARSVIAKWDELFLKHGI
jgi:hypothetical protein